MGASIWNPNGTQSAINALQVDFLQRGLAARLVSVASVLYSIVTPQQFGAVADGQTHPLSTYYTTLAEAQVDYPFVTSLTQEIDSVAIQAAINALETLGGGRLIIPCGTYLLSETITIFDKSIHIEGESTEGTILKASHTSGPVLQLGRVYCSVSRLWITSTSTRAAAAAGTNYGILDLAPDVAGQQTVHTKYEHLLINLQPSHAFAFVSYWKAAEIIRCRILDCGGHGVYSVQASELPIGYINSAATGGITVRDSLIYRTTGNAIAIGAGASSAYRVELDNVDIAYCALTAGVRLSAHAVYVNAENTRITRCGIGGWSGDSPRVLTIGGIYANGRSPYIVGNRFIDVLGNAITLGASADGAWVDANQVTGDVIVALNPAVVVESGCTGVAVRWGFPANVTTAMTPAASNTGNRSITYDVSPQGHRSALTDISIADDAVYLFTFTGLTRGIITLAGNSATARSPIIAFRLGDGSAYCSLLTSEETGVAVTTGVLTGTTGVDGNLTISAGTASNTLYIENRRGAALTWMPTFLSLSGGELVI